MGKDPLRPRPDSSSPSSQVFVTFRSCTQSHRTSFHKSQQLLQVTTDKFRVKMDKLDFACSRKLFSTNAELLLLLLLFSHLKDGKWPAGGCLLVYGYVG